MQIPKSFAKLWERLKEHPLARVGPGLITGVADDDPSGIATYSQAGAKLGFNLLWTMPVAYPMMAAVQSMCAQIGRVTGKGLTANMKTLFHPGVVKVIVISLLIANTLNISADLAAMGEVAQLVLGYDRHLMTGLFVAATLILQVFVPYHRYVHFLKWLTLSLLAYVAVLFTVNVPWEEVARRTFWPHLGFDSETATLVLAVFGTTISPYLFFWQASQEIEDMRTGVASKALLEDPAAAPAELNRIKWDTWTGMLYSNLTSYFIILATALTLHASGVTDIQTAAEAASALRPLAGEFTFLLFGLGILGVGLIGVPVLAGSAGYALAEAMGWKWGLERKLGDARGFYGVIGVSVLAAVAIQYSPISPIKALFWSAVINGAVAVPLMVVIIILASSKSVMGNFSVGRATVILAWLATALMGAAFLGIFVLAKT